MVGEIMKYSKESLSTIIRVNVKKYRIIAKITQQELADACGLTHGYIRDLESLKVYKTPTVETLAKLCNALDVDVRQLFDDIE